MQVTRAWAAAPLGCSWRTALHTGALLCSIVGSLPAMLSVLRAEPREPFVSGFWGFFGMCCDCVNEIMGDNWKHMPGSQARLLFVLVTRWAGLG